MLQLFIAVSMIVLVLEEVRYKTERILAEAAAVRSEKEKLEAKVISSEEKIRHMYDQVRLTEGSQKAYDELRRTQQTVVQQERLRALGQMASGVAHDINNALSPISAYTELLIRTIPSLSADSRRYLNLIRGAATDVAQIVGRMREFYRQRTGAEQLVPVHLDRLLSEVSELTRPRWRDDAQLKGTSIDFQIQPGPALPPVLGDPAELREALINLVFNAVDALPSGGTITLAARLQPWVGDQSTPPPARQIIIEVRDNGTGMDESTRRHCLEPFFTTKAQRGTGLGLSMVYGMVQRHGGQIEIESAPLKGTTVRLIFPDRSPLGRDAAPAAAAGPNLAGRPLRILCVDDEPRLRQLLADCLGSFGHRVAVAGSGREGLSMFETALAEQAPFELVVTDLGMPDCDGHQFARGIKAAAPHTPVVMMTGWGQQITEEHDTPPSVDAILGKPPKLEELVATIRRLAS